MGTFYDDLGVARSASHDEVRRAYRQRAKALHPDARHGRPDARADETLRRVNRAWSVLSDPVARRRYDARLPPLIGATGTGPSSGPSHLGRTTRVAPPVQEAPHPGSSDRFRPRFRLWVLAIGILGAIFVATAYAGESQPTSPVPVTDGGCISVQRAGVLAVPCGTPGAVRVVAQVADASDCPTGSRPQPSVAGWRRILCVEPAT